MILIINQKYYKIMKVCVTILILIMLLIGMKRVCAQEHRHKIDSVNNIVLYFKIDGAILDSTYMGNSKSLKKKQINHIQSRFNYNRSILISRRK